MNRVVVRFNEYCPECGAVNSFRKYASRVEKGKRRIYARCSLCGKKVTIIYQDRNGEA